MFGMKSRPILKGDRLSDAQGVRDGTASGNVIDVGGSVPNGNFLSRHTIWITDVGEESRVCRRGDIDAGAGDWREHGAIFCGERSFAESTSLSAGRTDRCDWREQGEFRERVGFVSEFSRLAEREHDIFRDGCLSAENVYVQRRR